MLARRVDVQKVLNVLLTLLQLKLCCVQGAHATWIQAHVGHGCIGHFRLHGRITLETKHNAHCKHLLIQSQVVCGKAIGGHNTGSGQNGP
jgi:hypothetical protein